MSYKLEKPFTNVQKADFICLHQGLNYYEDRNCIIMYYNSETIKDGEIVDISNTSEYKAKVKSEIKKQITLSYKDKFNEFDGIYAARVARGLSTIVEMNTKRATLQSELTAKLQEIDNG